MKKKKSLSVGMSILLLSFVISLIAIFIPDGIQGPVLFFTLVVWNVWVVCRKLIPFVRRKKQLQQLKAQKAEEAKLAKESNRPLALVMMLHVNLRITEKLHDIYPEATWAWCQKDPEAVVINGGIGRIRVNGVEDYEYADVKVELNGNISLSMVKQMPEMKLPKKNDSHSPAVAPMNPQIWYEQQGRKVLQNVITDLHSRGHSNLTVGEDGSIIVHVNDEDITQSHLMDFPAKRYWPQLIQVFQREGLAAQIIPKGVQVTW